MEKAEINNLKAHNKNLVDVTLLGICITVFTLVSTIKPVLFQEKFFAIQLALTVPFFMSALISRIKQAYKKDYLKWGMLALISFTIAFGFLINVIGLLLSIFAPIYVAMAFFAANILLDLVRTGLSISLEKDRAKRDLTKSIVHLLMIVLLGILPALRVY